MWISQRGRITSRKSGTNNKYFAINDRIGNENIHVEGTEAPRSFSEGTGIRKYDKNDPSVAKMRKERAKTYAKYGIGFGLTAQSQHKPIQSDHEILTYFANGRRKNVSINNIKSISDIKSIINGLTGIVLTDYMLKTEIEHRIINKTLAFFLLIQNQEDDACKIKIRYAGVIKLKKRITLLKEVRKQKQTKAALKKTSLKNYPIKHANNIRGFDTLNKFRKG